MDLCDHDARWLRAALGSRRIRAVELLESCIARIEDTNGALNAFVALDLERALDAARAADARCARGEPLPPLHGLPVGIKDLNDTQGLTTTYGSSLYRDHVPVRDEWLVARIRAAGGIILGKTNTPEFGAGSHTANEVHGATANPFDLERSPGGSSGGSAAALAAGMVPLAQGSDTGGSLRASATWCGVASIRPTPGVVGSDRRTMPLSFFSVQGPMARTVDDLSLLLAPMSGPCPGDPLAAPVPYEDVLEPVDLARVRIGFSTDLGVAPVESRIRTVFEQRIADIAPVFASADEAAGSFRQARDVFWILRSVAFLASHSERYRVHGERLSANIRTNVEPGLAMDAARVAWAHREWGAIIATFERLFDRFDIVLVPGNATVPFRIADGIPRAIDGEPLENYMDASLVRAALSLTGHPVVALPCGRDSVGLPFGFQVVGRRHCERELLSICRALEQHLDTDPLLARPRPAPPHSVRPAAVLDG